MLPLMLTNLSILLVYEDEYKISQYSLYIEGGYINKIKTQTALIWHCGQVVKTSPFHGGIVGSTPASVTIRWAKSKVQGPTQRCEISQFHSYADDDAAEFKER